MRPVKVGIMVLAAGNASRMGSPKQLLEFRGKTLLRRAAETAAAFGTAVVVLGDNAESLAPELAALPVEPVINQHWQQGMGTSIRAGLAALLRMQPELDACLVTLCDQPLVTAELLGKMQEAFVKGGHELVACSYGGQAGVPALFGRSFFAKLAALPAAGGAKIILREHEAHLITTQLPEMDIDTPEDYAALKKADEPRNEKQ